MRLDTSSAAALRESLIAVYGPEQGPRLYAAAVVDNPERNLNRVSSSGAGLFNIPSARWKATLKPLVDAGVSLNIYGQSPASMMQNYTTLSRNPDVAGWVADRLMDEDHRSLLGWVNKARTGRGEAPVDSLRQHPSWGPTETDAALLALYPRNQPNQPGEAIVGANGAFDMGGLINAYKQAARTSTPGADFTRPLTTAIAGNQLLFKVDGGKGRALLGLDPDEIKSIRAMTPRQVASIGIAPREDALNQLDAINQQRQKSLLEDDIERIHARVSSDVLNARDPAYQAITEPVTPEDIGRLGTLQEQLAGTNQNIANLNNLQDVFSNQISLRMGGGESVAAVLGEATSGPSPVQATIADNARNAWTAFQEYDAAQFGDDVAGAWDRFTQSGFPERVAQRVVDGAKGVADFAVELAQSADNGLSGNPLSSTRRDGPAITGEFQSVGDSPAQDVRNLLDQYPGLGDPEGRANTLQMADFLSGRGPVFSNALDALAGSPAQASGTTGAAQPSPGNIPPLWLEDQRAGSPARPGPTRPGPLIINIPTGPGNPIDATGPAAPGAAPAAGTPPAPGRGPSPQMQAQQDALLQAQLANFQNTRNNQRILNELSVNQNVRIADDRRGALAMLANPGLPRSAQLQDFAFSAPLRGMQSQAGADSRFIEQRLDPLGDLLRQNNYDRAQAQTSIELMTPAASPGFNPTDPQSRAFIDFIQRQIQGGS